MTVSKTRQVVILGAGYDDLALRFRSPGVTFFELDHPNTASDKQARLAEDRLAASTSVDPPSAAVTPAAGAPCCRKCDSNVPTVSASGGPVLAAAEFAADDDGAGVLARARHDPEVPALFACEGLLVYLDRPANVRLINGAVSAADLGTGAHPGRSLLVAARPAEGSWGSAPAGRQGGLTWLP